MTLTFERLLVGENNKDPHVTENMNNMTRKELHKFKVRNFVFRQQKT